MHINRFRWVALQYDELMQCFSRRELEDQLKSLPRGLYNAYSKILERSSRREDLKRFLQWIAYSIEPMTLEEIAETAAIDFGKGDAALPVYDCERRYEDPQDVLNICYGFVIVVKSTAFASGHPMRD